MRIGGNHRALRVFLAANEGKLRRSWNRHNKNTAAALTRADFLYALRWRDLPQDAYDRIHDADTAFVKGELERVWNSGLKQGGQSVTSGIRQTSRKAWDANWQYSPAWRLTEEWIMRRTGLLITQWGTARRGALQTVISAAVQGNLLSSGESASAFYIGELIKASFGLTDRQAGWIVGYAGEVRKTLLTDPITSGLSPAHIDRIVNSKVRTYEYALTQTRAQTIARTETASAFNEGQLTAIKEAQAKGYLGEGKLYKVWSAARNEPCDECQELDGTRVLVSENFGGHGAGGVSGETPPLHPNCRCTLYYETE